MRRVREVVGGGEGEVEERAGDSRVRARSMAIDSTSAGQDLRLARYIRSP